MIDLKTGINEYEVSIKKHQLSFLCNYRSLSTDVVLFIHGLACSRDSFRNVLDQDYFPDKSLLLLDLVGFGNASKPMDFSYKMEDQAEIVAALLSGLPTWNIHIAAHSMGGAVALLLPPDTYSRVRSFANIEGNLTGDDCGLLSRGITDISFDEYKEHVYIEHSTEFRNHDQLCFDKSNPFAIYHSAASLVEHSDSGKLLDKFKNLSCRKAYFYGEKNKEMPILKRLNFVQKHMIQNAGHGMMTESPQEFYTKLADFITSHLKKKILVQSQG